MRSLSLLTLATAIVLCAQIAAGEELPPTAIRTVNMTSTTQLLAIPVATVAPLSPIPDGKNQASGTMLILTTRIYDKAPNGDQPGKGSKLFLRPRIATLENAHFSMRLGAPSLPTRSNELDNFGPGIDGRMGPVRDGKVRVDLTFLNTTAEGSSEDHLQLHTDSHRIVTTLKIGEISKVRLVNFNGNESVWAEFQVDEIKK